jgi:hypothetical protein
VKWNLTIRQGVLLLLALFGLMIGGVTFFTVRYVSKMFVEKEYLDDRDDLVILARQIEKSLDDKDEDPFRFVEATALSQAKDENFSFMVRDSTGIVVSPAFMDGKEIPIEHFKPSSQDGFAGMARVWNYECFVIFYPLSHHPYELVAVYDYKYVFGDNEKTLRLFVSLMVGFFFVVALLTWFWLAPVLESSFSRRQRAEGELQAAHDLQQKAVTNEFPPNPFFETYAVLQPAREVGGDIYRCGFQDGKYYFLIGDVSDKGVAAGLLMFTLSSYVGSRTRGDVDICGLMKELNCLVCDNPQYEMLCTLFLGAIDPETLEMEYCNAGHTRTMVSGEYLEQDPQLLAGIDREYEYHSQKVQLKHGDRVLLYTDGVTEARGEDRSFFGEARLQEWMKGLDPSVSSEAGCRSLLDTLSVFRGNARQNDDIAIIYIKVI